MLSWPPKDDHKLPKLGTTLGAQEREISEGNSKKGERSRDRRNVHLVTRYNGNWHKSEHKTIHECRNKFGLKCLHMRMVNKHYVNLKEMLPKDIHQKVMDGVFDEITAPKTCNCWNSHRINGTCICKGKFKTAMVIYKIKHKICGKFYMGKTQNLIKSRIFTHMTVVGKL